MNTARLIPFAVVALVVVGAAAFAVSYGNDFPMEEETAKTVFLPTPPAGGPRRFSDRSAALSVGGLKPTLDETDAVLPGVPGQLPFTRRYSADPNTGYSETVIGAPFGADENSEYWTHNFNAFLVANNPYDVYEHCINPVEGCPEYTEPARWELVDTTGATHRMEPCTPNGDPVGAAACWSPELGTDATSRLFWDGTSFVLYQGGVRYYFSRGREVIASPSRLRPTGTFHVVYLLDRIEEVRAAGINGTIAQLSYFQASAGLPPGCTTGAAPRDYLKAVTSPNGVALEFQYRMDSFQQCVIQNVHLRTPSGVLQTLVTFDYPAATTNLRGRITAAHRVPGLVSTTYSYPTAADNALTVHDNGILRVKYGLVDGGTITTYQTPYETGSVSVKSPTGADCSPGKYDTTGGCTTQIQTFWKYAPAGSDLSTVDVEYVGHAYTIEKSDAQPGGVVRRVEQTGAGGGFTAWVTEQLPDAGLSNRAVQDPFGWTRYENRSYAAGTMQPDVVPTWIHPGRSGEESLDELMSTGLYYSRLGAVAGFQLVPTAEYSLGQLGARWRRTWYEPDAPQAVATSVRGNTETLAGTVQTRIVKTFFNKKKTCLPSGNGAGGGQSEDPFGRIVEVVGPCEVSSEDAGVCLPGQSGVAVRHTYFGDAGTDVYQLVRETTYVATNTNDGGVVSCDEATAISSQSGNYDIYGRPRTLTDPNGGVTYLEYAQDTGWLLSSTQGTVSADGGFAQLAKTSYVYDYGTGKPLTVTDALGLTVRSCYRTNANAKCDSSATSPATDLLQWVQTENAAGGIISKTTYEYSDGRVIAERVFDGVGTELFVRKYGRDGLGRVTYTTVGDVGTTAMASASRFANGKLAASGVPYNKPTGLCGNGACSSLTYDRMGRPATTVVPTEAGEARKAMAYDRHGNTISVSSTESDLGAVNAGASVSYRYDDFGNIIGRSSSFTGGEARTVYDVAGRPVAEKSGLGDVVVQYAYDALGRLLTQTGDDGKAAFSYSYDNSLVAPSMCAAATPRTLGRTQSLSDSRGRQWYSYDTHGNIAEIRRSRLLPTGTYDVCSEQSKHLTPNSKFEYDASGSLLTKMTYPHGREVFFEYGADKRVSAISTKVGSTVQQVVTNVQWDADGALRSYEVVTPSGGVATVNYFRGGDPSSMTTACSVSAPTGYGDKSGRPTALWVSTGAASLAGVGTGQGDIFKRHYNWDADQVAREDTCLLNNTGVAPSSVLYEDRRAASTSNRGYDTRLRLRHTSRPAATFASQGGVFGRRDMEYDPDGNLLREVQNCSCFAYDYSAGNPTRKYLATSGPGAGCACSGLVRFGGPSAAYAYDFTYGTNSGSGDGRRLEKLWPRRSNGVPDYRITWDSSTDSARGIPGSGYKAVSVNGTTYNYWYDASGRRHRKDLGSAGKFDEYFYAGTQLIEDIGHTGLSGANEAAYVVDEYIWLAGKPVVLIKAPFDANWNRLPETAVGAKCPRIVGSERNQDADCGVYFPVADFLGKPVLALDGKRLVAGAYDYDVSGHVNRVAQPGATPANYPENTKYVVTMFKQPPGAGMQVDMRLRVALNDRDVLRDTLFVTRIDGTTQLLSNSDGPMGTDRTSAWFTVPTDGVAQVRFHSDGIDEAANGVIVEGYDYRRYQVGAAKLSLPLRFPGQYYDAETDTFENWNRFYDPNTMRYLSPDPALRGPAYAVGTPWGLQPYSYASSNPITGSDPDGLLPLRYAKPLVGYSIDVASGFQPSFKDLLNECNGGKGLTASCIAVYGWAWTINTANAMRVDEENKKRARIMRVYRQLLRMERDPRTRARMLALGKGGKITINSAWTYTNGGALASWSEPQRTISIAAGADEAFAFGGFDGDNLLLVQTNLEVLLWHEFGHAANKENSNLGALEFQDYARAEFFPRDAPIDYHCDSCMVGLGR